MKFYVCGCLFDNYVYLLYKKEGGFLTVVGDKLKNGKWCTFIYHHRDLICVCYSCLILLLKVRKYNVDSLGEVCDRYTSDAYISRVVVEPLSARRCFESVLPYLRMEEYSSDVESLINMICLRCLKHLVVCYNLFSDLYVLKN